MCFINAKIFSIMIQKRKRAHMAALAKAKKKNDLKKMVDSFLLPLTSRPTFDLRSEFPHSLFGEHCLPFPPGNPDQVSIQHFQSTH
jgi:hypothetical protein